MTFQAKEGQRWWRTIGTDDNAPYQVFHDTADLRSGTSLQYRAVVLDNAGHARMSGSAVRRPGSDSDDHLAEGRGGGTALPGVGHRDRRPRTRHPVGAHPAQRRGRDWGRSRWTRPRLPSPRRTTCRTSTSARRWPTERSLQRAGASVPSCRRPRRSRWPSRCRCTHPSPWPATSSRRWRPRRATDWDPACAATDLAFDVDDGLWHGTFTFAAGEGSPSPPGYFEWKIATGHSFSNPNFGENGGGDQPAVSPVPADGGTYEFTFDQIIPCAIGAGGALALGLSS